MNSFKDETNIYKKADIDYEYTINRGNKSRIQRYEKRNGIYRKSDDNNSNKAILLCCGDIMCEPVMSGACCFDGEYDFRPCFKQVKAVLNNCDFAIGNLETIVSDRIPYAHEKHRVSHHTGLRYHCNAPVSYLDALKYAGFDAFVLANNHNADGGYEGIVDTVNNVDNYGFMHTGMYRNEKDDRILLVNINGIMIAVLSYTEHINRKLDTEVLTERGCNVLLNHYSSEKIISDVNTAKSRGAEFVIVYIHFLGKEYSHEIWNRQRNLALEIANAGVDCIMGSHVHVIQEYDQIAASDGRIVPVVYSLGNFISSDGTTLDDLRNIIYRLVLEKENGTVKITDESYIPMRTVIGTRKAAYIAFPTQGEYAKVKQTEYFKNEEKIIIEEVGTKIHPHQFGSN